MASVGDDADFIFERFGLGSSGPISGLNLVLELERSTDMPCLLLEILGAMPKIRATLTDLNFVHFARFLPTHDHSALQVITEFDGPLEPYVMDFAIALEDEFSMLMSYVRKGRHWQHGWRVRDRPAEFLRYVKENNRVKVAPGFKVDGYPLYGAYEASVLDIAGARKALPPPALDRAPAQVDVGDVQGNILRGYRACRAVHVFVHLRESRAARRFIAGLLSPGGVSGRYRLTTAATWSQTQAPDLMLNLGLTCPGLHALGVDARVLEAFPPAFREGAAARAKANCDTENNAPEGWRIGTAQARSDDPACVHMMLSLYTKTMDAAAFAAAANDLLVQLQAHQMEAIGREDAAALPDERDYFGYRDGISNPRLAMSGGAQVDDRQPLASVGEFLLGPQYMDIYGGPSIRGLPQPLAHNGAFCAVRIIEQRVAAFTEVLDRRAGGLAPDELAARLMGRWRDGRPLAKGPASGCMDNDFDYAPSYEYPDTPDDHAGLRCPVGAHIRRMNPRGARVAGARYTRRLIRRGMPYARPAAAPGPAEVGMFGMFFCGDLERQFEFILREWANGDRFASGLVNTRDPFAGSHRDGARFVLPVQQAAGTSEVVVELPAPLTAVRGSVYLFYPGVEALRLLGASEAVPASTEFDTAAAVALWNPFDDLADDLRRRIVEALLPAPGKEGRPTPVAPGFDHTQFDPTAPRFLADPYPTFKKFRDHTPVCYIPRHRAYWVFTSDLVRSLYGTAVPGLLKANPESTVPRGLLTMEAARHAAVRSALQPQLHALFSQRGPALARAATARAIADLGTRPFDLVDEFARRIPREVFFDLLGPADHAERLEIDRLARRVMIFSDRLGGTAQSLAMLAGLQLTFRLGALAFRALVGPPSIARLIGRLALRRDLSPQEALITLLQFVLAGYLSTEFLLSTAVRNLLRNSLATWPALAGMADATMADALDELRRFDSPLGVIDRFAGNDGSSHDDPGVTIGALRIPAGCLIMGMLGSANRDDRIFALADRLDLGRFANDGRPMTQRHLALGDPARDCIGAPLQQIVAPAALRALSAARPQLRLLSPTAEPPWIANVYFRSYQRLLVQ